MRILRSIVRPVVLVVIFFTSSMILCAQSVFDPSFHEEASQLKEHLEVFTDRSLYTVNEMVQFRAETRIEGIEVNVPWSSVLYMELISATGQAFAESKFSITDGVCRGGFTIPSNVLTGSYYLKCYTRWMRNWGPVSFSYVPIRIINPFKSEVGTYSSESSGKFSVKNTEYKRGLLELRTSSNAYERGGEVLFHLAVLDTDLKEGLNCCVTIVPVGSIDTLKGQYNSSEVSSDPPKFSINYLPDIGGASLSGRAVQSDGTPGAKTMLHFSLLGNDPDYFVTITDGDGRFVIPTPHRTGDQELFVVPIPSGESQVEIKIDQDFDQGELHLPDTVFNLTEQERAEATAMAIRMQMARTYIQLPGKVHWIPDSTKEGGIPFYGTRVFRLELDDFVDLPSLEEVFINLVPDVFIVTKRDKHQLKIKSANNAIGFYPPLVMIDNIPVFDLEAVLDLVPEKIRRIDLINEIYIKGGIYFGGVVSLYSRDGDMAGIDLSPGSYFFDFRSVESSTPEIEVEQDQGDRIPDTRNTILWLDNVSVAQGSPVNLRCIAPDQPGDYLIFVRGVSPRGKVHSATTRFRIK